MSIFYIENSSINNYLSESGGVRKKNSTKSYDCC